MSEREELKADLERRLRYHTNAGLQGLLRHLIYNCRLCGSVTIRRDSWMEVDGSEFVKVQCSKASLTGCPYVEIVPDPDPPPQPRKPRVGKARQKNRKKDVRVHA